MTTTVNIPKNVRVGSRLTDSFAEAKKISGQSEADIIRAALDSFLYTHRSADRICDAVNAYKRKEANAA